MGENRSVLRGRLTYHFAATSRRQHQTRIVVGFLDRSAALTRIISSDISRIALGADLQCAGSYETYGALAAFLASGRLHFGSILWRGGRTGRLHRRSDHENEMPSSCRLHAHGFDVRRAGTRHLPWSRRRRNRRQQSTRPVGAVVGGAIGAATGTVGGILGVAERPRFREYVIREHHPSFRYRDEVRIGAVLPERGVTLYAVPREYHVRPGYRYAIVNDRPVIVEPRTRRIVEIIE